MMTKLDPHLKALLQQFQANAAQHPAPLLSATEKMMAIRQMTGAALRKAFE
jgi:hypothetical protein